MIAWLALAFVDRLQDIADDMRLAHQGIPHGVAVGADWRLKPRIGMGNDPKHFRAMTAWGQAYAAEAGSPATNTRIQIRNVQAWLLRKPRDIWERVQFSNAPQGAFYREDFAGDANKPSDARAEPSGGISVRLEPGFNYHFWPSSGRVRVRPEEIGGWYTTVESRLVLDDPKKPDDRDKARLLMSMGGDYWLAMDSQWDQWKTNGDIAIGRFRFIRNHWQSFHMTTVPSAQLRKNPPPESID